MIVFYIILQSNLLLFIMKCASIQKFFGKMSIYVKSAALNIVLAYCWILCWQQISALQIIRDTGWQ